MTRSPRIALVTGGAKRIGKAIVEDLAANGWAVVIHYNRSQNEAEFLADAIRAAGGSAAIAKADLADAAAAAGLIEAAEKALGKPRLLVNNASIFERDAVGALDSARFARQIAINLTAPIFLTQAFVAALPEDEEGNVVNLIDQRVWKLTPRFFSYQLSKSALWTATQTLAQALAPRVRVNAIAPGPALRNERQPEQKFRRLAGAVPLRHGPDLAEFGRTVRYFVENRSITGQMIALDGGQHLAWQTPDIAELDD
jgi:NAD(P)-dependent dehydrogenase (short-subunit alcohol dehydrogenase family)